MAGARVPAAPRCEEGIRDETRLAPMYKVLLHNDDVTPFLFVERQVCQGIFKMEPAQAHRVTSEVHYTGIGLAGVYALEQAEFKCDQVRSLARGRGYPLMVTYERA